MEGFVIQAIQTIYGAPTRGKSVELVMPEVTWRELCGAGSKKRRLTIDKPGETKTQFIPR